MVDAVLLSTSLPAPNVAFVSTKSVRKALHGLRECHYPAGGREDADPFLLDIHVSTLPAVTGSDSVGIAN